MPGCPDSPGMRGGPPMGPRGPCLGPGIIMAGGMGRPAIPAPGICIPAVRRCWDGKLTCMRLKVGRIFRPYTAQRHSQLPLCKQRHSTPTFQCQWHNELLKPLEVLQGCNRYVIQMPQ